MDIAVLKILLWILLAILLLVVAVCLLNVKITVGNRGKFTYNLSVGGIRIDPMRFIGKKNGHGKKIKDKAAKKKSAGKKKSGTGSAAESGKPKKKSLGSVLYMIARIGQTAVRVLPRGVRIRLKYLNIRIGGSDAAKVAVNYGRIYAVLSGLFALFDGYRGFLYGFRARRNKVNITADFLTQKTTAEFEMVISFFVWQLLFSGIRIGVSAIGAIIENTAQEESENDENGISGAERIINNAKNNTSVPQRTNAGKK